MTTRRSILAAGAGLAAIDVLGAGSASATGTEGQNPRAEVAGLLHRSEQAHAALMAGDTDRYAALVPLSDDFTLFSPFGGEPTRGAAMTPDRIAAMGRFFRDGTMRQEVVQTYATADMVTLALIEWNHVGVGGLPPQPWPLRVTLVYRRDGGAWRLVHRHADPLVHGISLEQAAAIARGDGARPEAGMR